MKTGRAPINRAKSSFLLGLAALLMTTGSSAALAQVAPSEHASHHPGAASPGPASKAPMSAASAPPAGPAGMMDMMKPSPAAIGAPATVGGCCGARGGKPFYPAMMDLPALTREARQAIRTEAIARLGSGGQMLSAGQLDLHHAQSKNDFAGAQSAVATTREGLSLAESGISALQALNQSWPPRRIALTWFKNETAIAPNGDMIMDGGFRDLSWLHVAAMLILAAALGTMLFLRWQRLRRIGALADRLTPNGDSKQTAGVASGPLGGQGVAPPPSAPPAVQRPWKGVLRIKAIFDETPTVKTFRLMEANLGPFPFVFLPGQYATITSEIDGQKVRRSYTISSAPTQREYIELTVKREQHGLESKHLHDHAKTGDLLEITAPSGKFFFTGAEAKGIVLIAGGVGITPMMSVLRDLTDRSYEHRVHLICAANSPQDLIFREEIAYLARRHPNVTIASIVSKADGTDWTGPVGFITPDFIVKCAPDIAERRVHLCGPPAMMDAVKYALAQLKVPPDQIKTEDFAPPKGGPVPADEPEEPTPASAIAAAPAGADAAAVSAPSAQATVEFSTSGKSGTLAPDQSVLEAAEAIGVVIDFECRVGTCGRCKVPLSKGTVTMEVEDALTAEEKAGGTILACQAKSPGNLVVAA